MPTKADILRHAHRRLAIVSVDEALTADQEDYASAEFDYMLADLAARQGVTFSWALDAIPDAAVLPLGNLLAVVIGAHYEIPTEIEGRAVMRVRAYALPDDRTDRRDTDDSGAISVAEANAGRRAAYY